MFRKCVSYCAALFVAGIVLAGCDPTQGVDANADTTVFDHFEMVQGLTRPDTLFVGDTIYFSLIAYDTTGKAITDLKISYKATNGVVETATQITDRHGSGEVRFWPTGPGPVTVTATVDPTVKIRDQSKSTISNTWQSIGVPTAMTYTPKSGTVNIGGQLVFTGQIVDAQGNSTSRSAVSFRTLDKTIADFLLSDGVTRDTITSTKATLVGKAAGTARIVVYSGAFPNKIKPDTVRITVAGTAPKVATVQVTPNLNIVVGTTDFITYKLFAADGTQLPPTATNVTWVSNNTSIATVNQLGAVAGVAVGTTTISVNTSDGISGSATVTVRAASAAPASMTLTPSTLNITVGQTSPFTALVKDANGNPTTCTVGLAVDSSRIASSAGMNVTGKASGSTTVRAFCNEAQSVSATARLNVTDTQGGAASVTMGTRHVFLEVGGTFNFSATVKDANGTTLPNAAVTWSSDDQLTATVSPTGTVTAKSDGGAMITASSGGQKDIGWVTVGARGAIKGTLQSTSGQYLGATFATTTFGSSTLTALVNNEGIFYFAGLPAGTYTVVVHPPSSGTQTFTAVVSARQTTLVGNAQGIITVP